MLGLRTWGLGGILRTRSLGFRVHGLGVGGAHVEDL